LTTTWSNWGRPADLPSPTHPIAISTINLGQTADRLPTLRWSPVTDTVDSLILDLLEWIGPDSRPYAEVLDAWRTSCPRLPVWEDANDRGFVVSLYEPGQGRIVSVSVAGREHLHTHRPAAATAGAGVRRLSQLGT
jgi:hypothetical protein